MYCDVCLIDTNQVTQRKVENIDGTYYRIYMCDNCYNESLNLYRWKIHLGCYIKHDKFEEFKNKMGPPDIKEPIED